ncbi:MAG: amidohydrolase [Ruminococcaceae bacterium]|nr:amidohydrolase [Oscillospiraceae bacterium]
MFDFKSLVESNYDYMVEMRRHIHKRPCLSGDEQETSELIASQLETLKIPYHIDELGNVVGRLSGAEGGKRIALRADIDALPMQEDTNLPYASEKPGIMHACGHDMHTAALLGAARAIKSVIDELSGDVFFCFQVGEEQGFGALEIVDYLESQGGVDTCFAIHVDPFSPSGTFALKSGPVFSASTMFEITVTGLGGHGSAPWLSIDPIKPACEILLRLPSIVPNNFSIFDPVVISPCSIVSGTAANIVPEKAVIKGNIRFYDMKLEEQIKDKIKILIDSISESYGVKAEIEYSAHTVPPVINSKECCEEFVKVLNEQDIPFKKILNPYTASDNFSEFLSKYGGIYTYGGVASLGDEIIPFHNAKFSPDETALSTFLRVTLAYTFDFLKIV